MFYLWLRIIVRIALRFYCKKIHFQSHSTQDDSKPILLAASHPNSFLDAIIVACQHTRPLHFLARGDAFKNPLVAKILQSLHLIPIYRISEGKENLSRNEESFDACMQVLKTGGAVLIFSEGICKNEYTLRPLKKGTARLAHQAWYQHALKDLQIIPTTIGYNSFRNWPKTVVITTGVPISKNEITPKEAVPFYKAFNEELFAQLKLILPSQASLKALSEQQPTNAAWFKLLLSIPAALGFLFHAPLYLSLKSLAKHLTTGTVFYDSVLFFCLLIFYPFYMVLLAVLVGVYSNGLWALLAIVLLLCTAQCYKIWRSL